MSMQNMVVFVKKDMRGILPWMRSRPRHNNQSENQTQKRYGYQRYSEFQNR